MKKLLFLFGGFMLILTSCSSDDNSISEDTSVLPKTISYVYPDKFLGTNSINTLNFDGNKITSIIESDSKTVFTYTGDFITKQEVFDVDNQGKEIKEREVAYSYENGKLKTRIYRTDITLEYPEGNYTQKTVYSYTSNDLISYINYLVDRSSKLETKIGEGTLTYESGNLVKELQKVNSVTTTRVYEYDSKNNPLKNILGFNLLLNEISYAAKNNIIKTTRTSSENTNSSIYKTNYIYNDKDYPLKYTSFTGDGKTIEYEIEYTY